jgi:acyl-CoA synthetase (AMP-forming)/AMP-acid ligase II
LPEPLWLLDDGVRRDESTSPSTPGLRSTGSASDRTPAESANGVLPATPAESVNGVRSGWHDLGRELSASIDEFLTERGHSRSTYFVACLATVVSAWTGEETVTVGVLMPQPRSPRTPGPTGPAATTLLRVKVGAQVGAEVERDALLSRVEEGYGEVADAVTTGPPEAGTTAGPVPSPLGVPLGGVALCLRHREGAGGSAGYRLELMLGTDRFDQAVADELLRQVVHVATAFVTGAAPFRADSHPPQVAPVATEEPLGVAALVRIVAAGRPNDVAVISGGRRTTYGQLAAQADRIRAALVDFGIRPGDLVELRSTRTHDLPASLLGAWSSGATVAITDASAPVPVQWGRIDLLRPKAILVPGSPPVPGPSTRGARRFDGISHVVFTSGTSEPAAAVLVAHEPFVGALSWYVDLYGLNRADRVALVGGLGHDAMLRDLFAPLLAGATVIVPPADLVPLPSASDVAPPGDQASGSGRLFALLRDEQVTVLHATPALCDAIRSGRPSPPPAVGVGGGQPGDLDHLRLVVSTGAPLTAGAVRALREVTPAAVINVYSAAEAPQIASAQLVAAAGHDIPAAVADECVLPIGSGVAGARLSVVDTTGSPVPVGHVGEVVVCSPYLASDYLDGVRPGRLDASTGTFHTGDRGRRHPSGSIVLDGRWNGPGHRARAASSHQIYEGSR